MDLQFAYRATVVSFLCFCSVVCFSQPAVQVKASVDRNTILIGERIKLLLEANIPETQPIRFFSIDTIDHFEFIDKGKIDTINTSSGTRLLQQFIFTSFDSGRWVIPSYVLDEASHIQTDSIVIDVGFTPFDTSKPYNDIKDIIEVEVKEKKKDYWYYIAAAGTVLVLVLIYFITRKKKSKVVAATIISPYEEAMKQLEQIRKQELSAKEYYTRLTDIFRSYLAGRKNISSLQKTTDELVIQLKSLKMDDNHYSQLAQVLRLGDFVKFAKYQPASDDNKLSYDIIKNAVQAIENMMNAE